jgi:hypothetical protein
MIDAAAAAAPRRRPTRGSKHATGGVDALRPVSQSVCTKARTRVHPRFLNKANLPKGRDAKSPV